MEPLKISFAGAGRVAEALCTGFFRRGHHIVQISSRGVERGTRLAAMCNAEWIDNLHFNIPVDIIIVAVPDNTLARVLSLIKCGNDSVVAHTAGSFGLELFPPSLTSAGVFYPLQTFSYGRKNELAGIPFFLEASGEKEMNILKSLASSVSGRVFEFDTSRRRYLHLAAVFACNFTNHMITLAKQISSRTDIPFDVFTPLITETVKKAIEEGPEVSQTGPAVRNDTGTIKKHLELLSFSEELKKIYEDITNSISDLYRKNE